VIAIASGSSLVGTLRGDGERLLLLRESLGSSTKSTVPPRISHGTKEVKLRSFV
jgi:hypothetical protein